MKKYLSIGCDVQVSELDISLENGKYSLQEQADKYKAIFQPAMAWNKNPQFDGCVTFVAIWGDQMKLIHGLKKVVMHFFTTKTINPTLHIQHLIQ